MQKSEAQIEFEELSKIPRCSFHNEKIIEYAIEKAKSLGLEYIYDEKNKNVIIRRPAAEGKRDRTPVTIQGHMDMVAQTKAGVEHDFENEPLDVKTDGDFYYAEGTTLGADDGVAMAIGLALLKDKNLKNPPLELLLTTDEEVGMLSVKNADFSYLKGKYLINIDTEEEGTLVIGCCGGTSVKIHVPGKRKTKEGFAYEIKFDGFKGGHSGLEINKQRANAIKLASVFLYDVLKEMDFEIISFTAEGKDNAISSNAKIEIMTDEDSGKKLARLGREWKAAFRELYRESDPKINIHVEDKKKTKSEVFESKETNELINVLFTHPFGVLNWEQEDFTKPETSVNIGVVETADDGFYIIDSIRSSNANRAMMVAEQIENVCRMNNAEAEIQKDYPAWKPDWHSPMIAPLKNVYKEMFGKELKVEAVHAGLECGYILERSNVQAAVSLGPDMTGVHTPEEKLSISSFNRTYEYVKRFIESL